MRGDISFLTFRSELSVCGSGAMAWSTRRRCRAFWQGAGSQSRHGAQSERGRAVLPRQLLVLAHEGPGPRNSRAPLREGGNGIATTMRNQQEWIDQLKRDAALSSARNKLTRSIDHLAPYDSPVEAWTRRLRLASAAGMFGVTNRFGRQRLSRRLPTGPTASPPASCPQPPRPQGLERMCAVDWEWACPVDLHDETSQTAQPDAERVRRCTGSMRRTTRRGARPEDASVRDSLSHA